jgi:dCMP deaminase
MHVLNEKWIERFLNMASLISQWSKDESTKVGSVIVSPDGDPISFGYNGFPRGVLEFPERSERPLKYNFSEHAERNAIYLSRRDLRDCVMFCTHFPCCDCARAIIQSGIGTLVFYTDEHYSHQVGSSLISPERAAMNKNSYQMFREANVTVIGIT